MNREESEVRTADSPPEAEGFSWAKAFDAMEGDAQLRRLVMQAAFKEVPQSMSAVRQAVADNDADALRRAAHKLKGVVRYFGESPADTRALRLETMGTEDSLAGAVEIFAQLDADIREFTAALKSHLETDAAAGGGKMIPPDKDLA